MSIAAPSGTRWARWATLRRLIGPVVSVVSLSAVVWWALHQQAPRWPTGASSLLLLALAVLLYACVTAMRGVRWYAIMRRARIAASMADTQALIVVGYMGNTVLPARGGELLRLFFMGERTGCSRVTILGTIVAERLLDVVTLLLLLAIATATAAGGFDFSQLGLTAAFVLFVLALALLTGRWLSRTGRLRGLSGRLASLTLASRNLLSGQGVALFLLTAVVWMGEGCVYWLAGQALDLNLNLPQGCFLVALTSLAAMIPAAPGYVGTYDAAIQFGMGTLHVHGRQSIAFGLLVRLVIFVPITIAGLILVALRYGGLSSLGRIGRVRAPLGFGRPVADRHAVSGTDTALAPVDGIALLCATATNIESGPARDVQ